MTLCGDDGTWQRLEKWLANDENVRTVAWWRERSGRFTCDLHDDYGRLQKTRKRLEAAVVAVLETAGA